MSLVMPLRRSTRRQGKEPLAPTKEPPIPKPPSLSMRSRLPTESPHPQPASHHDHNTSASSSEDDDGIPATRTPQKRPNNTTDGQLSLKQHGARIEVHLPTSAKRRRQNGHRRDQNFSMRDIIDRTGERLFARSDFQDETAYPSPVSYPANDITSRQGRRTASTEEDLAYPDLINRINSMRSLRLLPDAASTPTQQRLVNQAGAAAGMDEDEDRDEQSHVAELGVCGHEVVKSDPDLQELELLEIDLSVEPADDEYEDANTGEQAQGLNEHHEIESLAKSAGFPEVDVEMDILTQLEDCIRDKRGQKDVIEADYLVLRGPYDVPVTPEPDKPTTRPREGAIALDHVTMHEHGAQPSHLDPVQSFEQHSQGRQLRPPQPAKTGGRATQITVDLQRNKDIRAKSSINEGTDEASSNGDDEINVDDARHQDFEAEVGSEVQSDIDDDDACLSTAQLFDRDVENFRNKPFRNDEDSVLFDGPPDGQSTSIHLEPKGMRRAYRLMKRHGWTGCGQDWETKFLQHNDRLHTTTPIARVLLHYLKKATRLYMMAPKAPRIAEQDEFFNEHKSLLNYYFCMIDRGVNSVRKIGLPFPKRYQSRTYSQEDEKNRAHLARDLVHVVIPMCIRALSKAWRLGGQNQLDTSFTSSTIHLLTRVVGWTQKLYNRLSRQLKRQLGDDYARTTRREEVVAREQLGDVLEDLYYVLAQAPDNLEEQERQHIEAAQRRRENFERQEHLKIQFQLEDEARQRAITEQNRRVATSIRGYSPAARQQTISIAGLLSPLRQASSLHYRCFPRIPKPHPSRWRREAETYLWDVMSKSLPHLPDLNTTAMSVSHSLVDTVAKAEEILRMIMQYRFQDEVDESEREIFIQQTMEQWKK